MYIHGLGVACCLQLLRQAELLWGVQARDCVLPVVVALQALHQPLDERVDHRRSLAAQQPHCHSWFCTRIIASARTTYGDCLSTYDAELSSA
jgi:hypothetical protein